MKAGNVIIMIASGVVAGCFLLTRNPSGFQERAREAGIAFRMHFLPKEQGEPFHINLYDHGAGLAVGDYDNDGREDIYFLDQRGSNALYRNMGNGTFVDVTAATGAYGSMQELTEVEPYGSIPVPVAKVCELTTYCTKADIHPTPAGYRVIADLVVDAYLSSQPAVG